MASYGLDYSVPILRLIQSTLYDSTSNGKTTFKWGSQSERNTIQMLIARTVQYYCNCISSACYQSKSASPQLLLINETTSTISICFSSSVCPESESSPPYSAVTAYSTIAHGDSYSTYRHSTPEYSSTIIPDFIIACGGLAKPPDALTVALQPDPKNKPSITQTASIPPKSTVVSASARFLKHYCTTMAERIKPHEPAAGREPLPPSDSFIHAYDRTIEGSAAVLLIPVRCRFRFHRTFPSDISMSADILETCHFWKRLRCHVLSLRSVERGSGDD